MLEPLPDPDPVLDPLPDADPVLDPPPDPDPELDPLPEPDPVPLPDAELDPVPLPDAVVDTDPSRRDPSAVPAASCATDAPLRDTVPPSPSPGFCAAGEHAPTTHTAPQSPQSFPVVIRASAYASAQRRRSNRSW